MGHNALVRIFQRSKILLTLATSGGILAIWQGAIWIFAPPVYILPSPATVVTTLFVKSALLAPHAGITLVETLSGLVLGIVVGTGIGLAAGVSSLGRRLAMPVMVVLQAVPVFALAPLLVLWFGYGWGSKIAMATLVIAFPVASALADGLRRTDPRLLDLATLAHAGKAPTLWLIRLPAALPEMVSGLRLAAVFAPIGAIIGEWVGSAGGLGYIMLQANARMQTDLLFAAIFILAIGTLALKAITDSLSHRLVPWVEDLSDHKE